MKGEAANVSAAAAEDVMIDRITSGLRDTIAAEVRKALQSSKREFSELAAEACSSNMDALAEKAAKKARMDMPEFQRKGTKNQFLHNKVVLEALDKNDVVHATERLKEGKKVLTKRLKAIKLADREEFGWAVVRHYESDTLASDTEDEKEIGRARRAAAAEFKKRQEKSKAKTLKRKRATDNSSSFNKYPQRPDFRSRKAVICFSCGKKGHMQKICFKNKTF